MDAVRIPSRLIWIDPSALDPELASSVVEWLISNGIRGWVVQTRVQPNPFEYDMLDMEIAFPDPNDAVLFKLRWS